MRRLKTTWTTITAFLLFASALAVPAVAEQKGTKELDYTRAGVERRPSASRPRKSMPRELRITVDATRPEPEARHRPDRPRGPQGGTPEGNEPDWRRLGEEARHAASELADDKVDRDGRRYLWTAGYYDGLHDALDDPRLGRWDRRDGFERGLRDYEARRLGRDLGYGEAEHAATGAALDDVAAQFHDLSREPRYAPSSSVPAFDVPPAGYAREPRLRDVFSSLTCHHDTPFGPLHSRPWELYHHSGYDDFYDRRFWNAPYAFGVWQSGHGGFWGRLTADEKDYFRDVFLHRYEREVARFHSEVAEDAYHRGFDHGYDHGAEIQYEWSYRQGFYEGWNEAFRTNARDAFSDGYRDTYADRYGAAFDEWSSNPRPEIGGLTLTDADDDGVFEPGEGIRLDYEVTNYGGAAGTFEATLSGTSLAAPASARLALPRRQTVRSSWPLEAVIDARLRPRTQGELDFRLAGSDQGRTLSPSGDQGGKSLSVYVSFPLELDRQVAYLAHDTLAGRAVVEVGVRNTSRRPVAGSLALQSPFLATPLGRSLDSLPAGGERRVTFELVGLRPLDLLSGTVELGVVATSRGKLHDEMGHRLPALALDLGERDLLEFMAALASGPAPPREEVRRAQELMLRRLRLDWEAVASDDGNAYKDDLKTGGRSTALGDLVATWRDGRSAFRHREVFTDLAPRIESLSEELPGAHPFLRRSMKKLARQLG